MNPFEYIITLLFIILQFNAHAQESHIQQVIFFNRIGYYPLHEADNKPDSLLNFCKEFKAIYYVDGLEMERGMFLEFNIKGKNVAGWYTYKYINYDTINCINVIKMHARTNIPVRLNGLKLPQKEKYDTLKQLPPDQIISIRRKSSPFGRDFIEVFTH